MLKSLDENIGQYCLDHSSDVSALLHHVERQTYLKTRKPRMMSGPILAQFYAWIIFWLQPKRILEVGTFTGYSTLAMAEQLPENGVIETIEVDPENHWLANQHFKSFDKKEKIISHLGDAHDLIPQLTESYDLILIDAGKKDNLNFYEQLLPKLTAKGTLIIDNTLWSGKILEENPDAKTQAILDFNQQIASDRRVEKLLLPVEDGLTLIRRRP